VGIEHGGQAEFALRAEQHGSGGGGFQEIAAVVHGVLAFVLGQRFGQFVQKLTEKHPSGAKARFYLGSVRHD
jgi:hypothetical protein